ncbi:helix-turn-helix domain-containing protein [Salinispora arenicola]|uniref:helix-turn-helix domain-containing protein n=1 Tax=Salinispora arenicola TaxID=168697 RepID=UPI0039AF5BF8
MSVMEQRYRAVQDVLAGSTVTDVAERFGVSRQAVHRWLAWYGQEGLEGLADRSSRPHSSPRQTPPEVEALICELRRNHPRWGCPSSRLRARPPGLSWADPVADHGASGTDPTRPGHPDAPPSTTKDTPRRNCRSA